MKLGNISANKIFILKTTLTIIGCGMFVALYAFSLFVREKEIELLAKAQARISERIENFQREKPTISQSNIVSGRNIFLYGGIDEGTAETVISALLKLGAENSEEDINLYINSSSGNFEDAFAIIGVMDSLECRINTIATGDCTGVGTFILCSGTGDVSATPNAIISIYIPGRKGLNSSDQFVRLKTNRILSFWKSNNKINLPPHWFENDEETFEYLSPEDAREYGIINSVKGKYRDRSARYFP